MSFHWCPSLEKKRLSIGSGYGNQFPKSGDVRAGLAAILFLYTEIAIGPDFSQS